MTTKHCNQHQQHPRFSDYGVDIDLLEYNLSLTPEQRILEHQAALDLLVEIEKARTRRDSQSE